MTPVRPWPSPRALVRRRPLAVLTAALAVGAAVLACLSGSPATRSPRAALASFANGSPIGTVLATSHAAGGLRVQGWDFDPSGVTTPLRTFATIDGHWAGSAVTASRPAPSLARQRPRVGAAHGFDWIVPVKEGTHTVCVTARNLTGTPGADVVLGCVRRTFQYDPVGSIEYVRTGQGQLVVRAWSYDPDAETTPLQDVVSIDGTAHAVLADRPIAVAAIPAQAGDDHGFRAAFPVSQGRHQVCVTAVNIDFGANTSLGCSTVTLDDSPTGAIDPLTQVAGKLDVSGWTYDPNEPSTPLRVQVVVDGGATRTVLANVARTDVAGRFPGAGPDHGFALSLPLAEGTHRVCVTADNVGAWGSDTSLGCRNGVLDFTPSAALTGLTATSTGATVSGWTFDPDTTAPIKAAITENGRADGVLVANQAGPSGAAQRGHYFSTALVLGSGTRTICAVGLNVLYGTHNSTPACRRIRLALSPFGAFSSIARVGTTNAVRVTGWALDPDQRAAPTQVTATVNGTPAGTFAAAATDSAAATHYPAAYGAQHAFSTVLQAGTGEVNVCLTAVNTSGGTNTPLGCKIVIAVNATAPDAPASAGAIAGYGGATISWTPPASDGGAPVSGYTVTASPGGTTMTLPPSTDSATMFGLSPSTRYTFSVSATNQIGSSSATVTAAVRTAAGPPPQTTPAPVSTSRYIRNVTNVSTSSLATMRAEGVSDATHNPSGHGYLALLDIGGQDQYDGGVVLSATTRFASYATLVRNIESYLSGYAASQRPSAPVIVAIGTNNDMDVNATTGAVWAQQLVNPLRSYVVSQGWTGITIAGADDIEPGFRATYSQTRSWLQGFLGATTAPFVFNGSADGCSWTVAGQSCNNGWTMRGLDYLAGGAAPLRILDLPQIYNSTMAAQWKYISMTGVDAGVPKIDFAGTLTEYTACQQSPGCGSLTGRTAWTYLWNDLQSSSAVRVSTLPYSTDLRIDW